MRRFDLHILWQRLRARPSGRGAVASFAASVPACTGAAHDTDAFGYASEELGAGLPTIIMEREQRLHSEHLRHHRVDAERDL